MDSSLDKFYRLAYAMADTGSGSDPAVPEAVIGRIAGSVVSALLYLYNLKVIHRDVKVSLETITLKLLMTKNVERPRRQKSINSTKNVCIVN